MQTHALSRMIVAVIAVIALAAPPAVMAITTTWTGGGDGTTWTDTGNWDNGVPVPGASDTVLVQGTMGSPITLDMTGSAANNIEDQFVTIEWADVQNGLLYGNDGTGSLLMENSTLATGGAGISASMPATVTLDHVFYFNTTEHWDLNSGHDVTIADPPGGQNEFRTGYWRIRSQGGDINMTVDGATNDPNWGVYVVGALYLNDAAASGNTATLTLSNGSGVRINNGGTIGTAGDGAAVLDLQSGMLRIDQGTHLGTTAVIKSGAAATLNLVSESGSYQNQMSEANWDGEGLIIQFGHVVAADRNFELAGTDDGATLQGFHDNFSIDELVIGNYASSSTTMDLVDGYDNNGASDTETLYTDRLDIDHAMTIDFNGDKKIYYKKLEGDLGTLTLNNVGSGGLIQVTGADLFLDPGVVHEPTRETLDADTTSTLDLTDADYGTVIIQDFLFSDPSKYFVLLDVTGAQIDIDALALELGASKDDADTLRLQYAVAGTGTDMFFDWNFSHLSVMLDSLTLETVPEPSTVLLLGIGGLSIYGWRRRQRG